MPVSGEAFVGRKDLLEELLEGASRHLLIGTPRIGKTSVLKQVQYLAHQRHQPAFYISLEGVVNHNELQTSVYRHLRREKSEWFDFAHINFDPRSFEREDFFEALFDLDSKLDGKPLFLLFDEAQVLLEIGQQTPDFLQKWRGALASLQSLKTIFAAFPRILQIDELIKETSPFTSGLPIEYLSIFTASEAEEFIMRPGIKIQSAQMAEILECTGRHPFFLQILCGALYTNGTLAKLTPEKFRAAYNSVPLRGILLHAFNTLSAEEKAVMQAVHQKDTASLRILRSEFPSSRSLESILDRLVSYGYLKRVSSGYKIINAFWSKWLEEEMLEPVAA
jgi:AAA+ ATPase superfamily predicted ATPase